MGIDLNKVMGRGLKNESINVSQLGSSSKTNNQSQQLMKMGTTVSSKTNSTNNHANMTQQVYQGNDSIMLNNNVNNQINMNETQHQSDTHGLTFLKDNDAEMSFIKGMRDKAKRYN